MNRFSLMILISSLSFMAALPSSAHASDQVLTIESGRSFLPGSTMKVSRAAFNLSDGQVLTIECNKFISAWADWMLFPAQVGQKITDCQTANPSTSDYGSCGSGPARFAEARGRIDFESERQCRENLRNFFMKASVGQPFNVIVTPAGIVLP